MQVRVIDLKVTFEDPKAYNRTWTLPVDLDLMPDGELIEYVCEDRDKPHLVGKRDEEFHVSREVLAQYAGRYDSSENRSVVVVTLEGDRLMIDPGGMGKIPLIAMSENSFSMEGNIVEFIKDEKGAVSKVVQHWTEGDRSASRRK